MKELRAVDAEYEGGGDGYCSMGGGGGEFQLASTDAGTCRVSQVEIAGVKQ